MLLSLFEHHIQHHFVSISCKVKRAEKCQKEAKTRVEKAVQDSVEVTEIDPVFWKLGQNWKETRRQKRQRYLSKKSFTYEIYAETSKAAHAVFQQ